MRILTFFLAAAAMASLAGPLDAQSLAEVARKEQDRRKESKASPKAYTNSDLRAMPAPVPQPDQPKPADAQPDAQPAPPAPAQPDADQLSADKGDSAEGVVKDRAYWGKRMQDARARLDRDRTLAEALQTRVNSLTADFVNRDDPAQRGKIDLDRQKSITELDRMKKSADDGAKAIAALEEEARRAGVPPGWLR